MSESTFDEKHGYYLEDLKPGISAQCEKTFSETDVTTFAAVSGDDNPLHLDQAFAANTRFERCVVHGMLTTSLWSALVGTRLPGPGCAYMGQELKFYKPVFVGDTVRAEVVVTRLDAAKQQAWLDAKAWVGDTLVAEGEARTWVPSRADYKVKTEL